MKYNFITTTIIKVSFKISANRKAIHLFSSIQVGEGIKYGFKIFKLPSEFKV